MTKEVFDPIHSGLTEALAVSKGWNTDITAAPRGEEKITTTSKDGADVAHGSYSDAHEIISRIWAMLGNPTYEQLGGRTIYDLVESAVKDADRYSFLKNHCSSHYPMTHEQPAEWSIGWEFQQSTPAEAHGSFDKWIDLDIEDYRQRQAEDEALDRLLAEQSEGDADGVSLFDEAVAEAEARFSK